MHVVHLLFWRSILQGYSTEAITQTAELKEFRKFQGVYSGETGVYTMRTTSREECLFHCTTRQNCTSMYYHRYEGWCIEPTIAIPTQGIHGWDLYITKGTSYHIYVNEIKTFDEARKNCESLGGYLACIGSDEEFSAILQLVPGSVWPWVGASEWIVPDVFHWFDGTLLENDDHKWQNGQPDNSRGIENCVRIVSDGEKWGLNDQSCDYAFQSVCEIIVT